MRDIECPDCSTVIVLDDDNYSTVIECDCGNVFEIYTDDDFINEIEERYRANAGYNFKGN